jgi:hypothetical protein
MIIDFSDTRETTKMPHENDAWEQRAETEKNVSTVTLTKVS